MDFKIKPYYLCTPQLCLQGQQRLWLSLLVWRLNLLGCKPVHLSETELNPITSKLHLNSRTRLMPEQWEINFEKIQICTSKWFTNTEIFTWTITQWILKVCKRLMTSENIKICMYSSTSLQIIANSYHCSHLQHDLSIYENYNCVLFWHIIFSFTTNANKFPAPTVNNNFSSEKRQCFAI